jgi:hypothetical protein
MATWPQNKQEQSNEKRLPRGSAGDRHIIRNEGSQAWRAVFPCASEVNARIGVKKGSVAGEGQYADAATVRGLWAKQGESRTSVTEKSGEDAASE